MMWRKGGKRLPPFLLATWGSGGRRFKIPNLRHSLHNVKVVRLMRLVPRSDAERGN
jgi:hypothetical protein